MEKKKKQGRVTVEERQVYLARLGSDAERGCPMVKTALDVWDLLAKPLGIELDDVSPVVKQALVVVLDTVIAAGRHSTGDLFHRIFDALASRWSLSFQGAGTRGAFTIYNVSEPTIPASYRELRHLVKIPLDDLWRHAVTKWVKKDGENPLYDVRREPFGTYQILLAEDPAKRNAFLKIVRDDEQYRREPRGYRLLLNEDPEPEREPQREVTAEWSFNEVVLGTKSEELLRRQEETRLIFDITLFRLDCQYMAEDANAIALDLWKQYEIDATLDHNGRWRRGRFIWSARHKNVFTAIPKQGDDYKARRRPVWIQLARYDRLRSLIDNFDEVYARTSLIPWGHIHAVEPGEDGGIGGILYHHRVIKSGFHRDINRRYAAAHFWPTNVPKAYRSRWFRVETPVPALAVTDPLFKIYGPPLFELVDRDISSSMTQILAVLLNIPDLEEKARSTAPKFNHYLANEALRRHGESGDLLADGYEGEDGYKKLVEFVKALWMRTLYGSAAQEVVYNLGMEVDEYGYGWRTRAEMWEDGWLEEATEKARDFLRSFTWYATVERYLHACQHLGDLALNKSRFGGVDFTDPSEGTRVRWNPVHRASKPVPVGNHYLYPSLPGRIVTKRSKKVFQPTQQDPVTGDYAVDRGKLKRQIAPMMVHMLDAYFSSLVIEGLTKAGIRDVVGINDAWYVPALFQAKEGGPAILGQETLDTVVLEAGAAWFQGLGSVYKEFVDYLGDTEDGRWFRDLWAAWRLRVDRPAAWPRFTAL